jgi:hypothetical protein
MDWFVLKLQLCLVCKVHVLPYTSCELHIFLCNADKFDNEYDDHCNFRENFLLPVTAERAASSVTAAVMTIENAVCMCLLSLVMDAVFLGSLEDCERSEINWSVSFRLVGFCITLVK